MLPRGDVSSLRCHRLLVIFTNIETSMSIFELVCSGRRAGRLEGRAGMVSHHLPMSSGEARWWDERGRRAERTDATLGHPERTRVPPPSEPAHTNLSGDRVVSVKNYTYNKFLCIR